jgi:hypothetical protein
MSDPHEIWQLGQWIARQQGGAARLVWTDGELILRIQQGRIRFVEGIHPGDLCERLTCDQIGHTDLLEEARELARGGQVAENHAMSAAKEMIQQSLRAWLLDPARELEIVEGEPDEVEGATISITHALVELVLSDTSGDIAEAVLPNDDALLVRSPGFLDLYAPLRLSEEADLIVSRISGERSVREVAEASDHAAGEVLRLLADPDETRQRIPVQWIVAAAAVLVIVLLVIIFAMTRSGDSAPIESAVGGEELAWGLVIDMGCEPQDLQRVLRKAQENPNALRPVAADTGDGEPCWRLVWGQFSSRDSAEAATENIPDDLLRQGFDPHPIELTGEELEAPASAGD